MSKVKNYWTVTTSIENLNFKYILIQEHKRSK